MNNTRTCCGSLKEKGAWKRKSPRACPSLATDFELEVLEGRIATKGFAYALTQTDLESFGTQRPLHGLVANIGQPDRDSEGQMQFLHQDHFWHQLSLQMRSFGSACSG